MKDKKVTALIVLAVLAVISLIYGMTAAPKRRAASSAVNEAERLLPRSGSIGVERRAKKSGFTSWKRSPFAPSGAPSTALVLNGILGNGKNIKAMVGDVIVGNGDKIGNNTVVDIKPDRVILNDGIRDFELKLKE